MRRVKRSRSASPERARRTREPGTLFPIFAADVRKADITPIEPFVVNRVEKHLRSESLPADALGRLDPGDVHLAKTASRSILGVMNDAALHARYRIEAMGGLDRSDIVFLNRFLRRTPNSKAGGYAAPLDEVERRLRFE
jgi:hypothetical protein